MKALLWCALLFLSAASASAENLVFYRIGPEQGPAWSELKDYFQARGHNVAVYQGETNLGRHLEKVSRINRQGTLFVALQLLPGDLDRAFVAVPENGKAEGAFLPVSQVPGLHAVESKRLADLVAASFRTRVRVLPLFPLLGVDMPGFYMRLRVPDGSLKDALGTLEASIQKYLKRDERQ